MSRYRQSSPQIPRFLQSTIDTQKNPETSRTKLKQHKKSFFQKTRARSIKTQISATIDDDDKQLLIIYNKNISKFRELVNSNDKTLLPFICSLRQSSENKISTNKTMGKTQLQPFQVAEKLTCNQKVQKELNDLKGRSTRISNALYRWHNKTGLNTKNSCFFQSKLRQTRTQFFNKKTFLNLFNPIEKPLIEPRSYKESELICQKQRRLFTIQN